MGILKVDEESIGSERWGSLNGPRGDILIRIAALVCALVAVPFLDGCFMHSYGPGMMDGTHGSPADAGRVTTLVKEVQRDDVTVTLEVPPLRVGQEASLRVSVYDHGGSAPIRDARVSVKVLPLVAGADREPSPRSRGVVLQAETAASPGVYLAAYTFEELGTYEIVVEVRAGVESGTHVPLVVTARQEARAEKEPVSRHGHYPFLVLGMVMMLVMMGAFMF